MKLHSSRHFLPLVFLAWLPLSCICSFNFVFMDSLPKQKTDTGTANGTGASTLPADQTMTALEALLGAPYLVATFPSGAEVYLFSPQQDDVAADPWVDVAGKAPAYAVITLDDEIAVSGADGMFYARVPLEEGLNEILCVASDLEGYEVAFSILIAYEPEEE
jgi:hypothetical protein